MVHCGMMSESMLQWTYLIKGGHPTMGLEQVYLSFGMSNGYPGDFGMGCSPQLLPPTDTLCIHHTNIVPEKFLKVFFSSYLNAHYL